MARGRCVGCGLENVSATKVKRHIASCPAYAEIYRRDPKAALEPEEAMEAHRAYKTSDEGSEAKEAKRADRLNQWSEFQETKASQAQNRWSQPGAGARMHGTPLTPEEVLDLTGARMYGERIAETDLEESSPTRRVTIQGFVGEI